MISIKTIILLMIFIDYISTSVNDTESANCPNPEDIRPCICDKDKKVLRCFASIDIDLDQIFKAVTNGKSDGAWNTFELSSPLITDIKDNVFHGMTFKTIKFVHCSNLACLSPTAFYGMERDLENFIGYNTTFSGEESKPNCNVFESLRRMKALKSIYITGSKIKEIPENAFYGGQYAITHIDLSGSLGGVIKKIGKNAFASLKNLKYLDVSQHQISKIDVFAFNFEDPSSEILTINLESNQLTPDSFEKDSFALNGRVVNVKLGGNPDLQVLKESIWRILLLNTGKTGPLEQNAVDVRSSPLVCKKDNLWLLENKGNNIQKKVLHATSAETDREFWLHTRAQCDK